jgi:hypothetical protein
MSGFLKLGDVTDTLIKATEKASEMEATDALVLLYYKAPGTEACKLKVVCSNEVTIETANWLLDKAKYFLLYEEQE